MENTFLRIIKSLMLPIAILIGTICFFLFEKISYLHTYADPLSNVINIVVPYFIFAMLFLAFLKIKIAEMKLKAWHFYLLFIEFFGAFAIALFLFFYLKNHENSTLTHFLYGVLACMVVPTAAAASVITGKLGGSQSRVTSYIIANNVLAAILIPFIFPLSLHNFNFNFVEEFYDIFSMTIPVLIFPLLLALFMKRFTPKIAQWIVLNAKDLSFYLWCLTLTTVSGKAVSNVYFSSLPSSLLWSLCIVSLFICCLHFAVGKIIGHFYGGYRVTAGQSFGQKNMVFGVYLATAYLTPAGAITAGFYILWQNVINSYQIYYKAKIDKKCLMEHQTPYQEI